jgi:nicotinamidase-related amidase
MAKKALLVIDMLNDFVKEGGSLVVPGAVNIIPRIREWIDKARAEKIPIIYALDAHRPDDPEFERWGRHAVKGTWGAEVVSELKPQPEDYLILKRRYDVFFGTELDLYLRELGVTELIITGVLTDVCVMSTAIGAYMRGYKITVPQNAVATITEERHRFALEEMKILCEAQIV